MKDKFERLFAATLGPITDEYDDELLRERGDKLLESIISLMAAARLRGQLKLVHSADEDNWLINVDASEKIKQSVTLFDSSDESVEPKTAAERVIDTAMQAIRAFIAKTQPVTLAEVTRAVKRVGCTGASSVDLVVSTLRKEPKQTLKLLTREGPLTLSLQASDGNALGDQAKSLLCRIRRIGTDHASIRIVEPAHRPLPWAVRRCTTLQIPSSLCTLENMTRLFRDFVFTQSDVMLSIKAIEELASGRIVGVLLDTMPP